MPVRSLRSSVLRWPSPEEVRAAARRWAEEEAERRPELLRLGYFGSYARGTPGVGSDLDWVAVVEDSPVPFAQRALDWDLLSLPVPAEILVYTRAEWERLRESGGRFARVLDEEAIWLVERPRRPLNRSAS